MVRMVYRVPFNHLKGNYAEYVREANPEYAG